MKNVISWFEIPASDFDRAVKFYSTIFDEPVKVDEFMGQELGFFPMEEDMDAVGGDIAPSDENNQPSPQGTRVYFNCEGMLDAVLDRVEKAGGKIVQPKFQLGEAGWIAMIQDSEGNIVGLHSRK